MAGGVEVVDPPKELPSGQEFLRQLPEWARWAEEMAFIVHIFSHAAQAHEHLSEVCANVTALRKNHRQDHPDVGYQRSCLAAGTAQHS